MRGERREGRGRRAAREAGSVLESDAAGHELLGDRHLVRDRLIRTPLREVDEPRLEHLQVPEERLELFPGAEPAGAELTLS